MINRIGSHPEMGLMFGWLEFRLLGLSVMAIGVDQQSSRLAKRRLRNDNASELMISNDLLEIPAHLSVHSDSVDH